MYTALYRTERPEVFSEVLGQEHIVRILRNQIKTDSVGHAYLFSGTRGTGKTTMARLLAKAVNCLSDGERPCGTCENCRSIGDGTFIDMVELDAASNRGIENIRELRESVNYPPAVGRRKVYIIDEVHMLTTEAHNALLKTLEEPPENVMFIMATTNPEKLPQTILSRCMRFDFRRIPEDKIRAHMEKICRKRGIKVTEGALKLLAANADGSVRDGLSLLDQCLSGNDSILDRDLVLEYLGAVSDDFYLKLTEYIEKGDTAAGLLLLNDAVREGKDIGQILAGWLSHYRSLLIGKYVEEPEDLLNISGENATKIRSQAKRISLDDINTGIMTLARTIADAKYSTQPRTLAELAVVMLSGGIETPGKRPEKKVEEKNDKKEIFSGGENILKPSGYRKELIRTSGENIEPNRQDKIQESSTGSGRYEIEEKPAAEPAEKKDAYSEDDLKDIWDSVWERLGEKSGSLYLARSNTVLAGIKGKEFKVLVKNDITLSIIERNREALVSAANELLGRPMKMVAVIAAERSGENSESEGENLSDDQDLKELAEDFKAKMGISPRIE
jgi:DNA polymerase-3 subunit gamma/tau